MAKNVARDIGRTTYSTTTRPISLYHRLCPGLYIIGARTIIEWPENCIADMTYYGHNFQ